MPACAPRSREEPGAKLTNAPWFDNPMALAVSADIDVFVELMGGDKGPALESVKAALGAGKHVVTANKALLARMARSLRRSRKRTASRSVSKPRWLAASPS